MKIMLFANMVLAFGDVINSKDFNRLKIIKHIIKHFKGFKGMFYVLLYHNLTRIIYSHRYSKNQLLSVHFIFPLIMLRHRCSSSCHLILTSLTLTGDHPVL